MIKLQKKTCDWMEIRGVISDLLGGGCDGEGEVKRNSEFSKEGFNIINSTTRRF